MVDKSKKIILFVNGDLPEGNRIISQIMPGDFLIAVDGGLRHMTALGLTPDLIIGDLDSADPDDVKRLRSQGVEVRDYPVDKNETDLELALAAALQMKPQTIWIVAALGRRIDQTLGNIFLLTQSQLADVDVRLYDGVQEVFLIHKSATISGKPGERISLLPLNGPASGIHTEGLAYPLQNETLYPDKTRGISNLMTSSTAIISVEQGLLICVHHITNNDERSA